ncbi:hypothetical protein KCU61_g210, partial [Aureobasidium melanogenum]
MHFRHDKEESLCSCVPLAMDRDLALKLDQRGLVDERLGLRVDGICSICVLDGSDRPCLLCDAFCLVELDIALGNLNPTIRLQGVPAPKRTRAQSSMTNLLLSMMQGESQRSIV